MLDPDADHGDDFEYFTTHWSDIALAHCSDQPLRAREAQSRVLLYYRRPIISYVRHALPASEEPEMIFHNFAEQFIQGKFRKADPGRGRFRYYLKAALFNLVRDYYRDKKRWDLLPGRIPPKPDVSEEEDADDRQFLELWRREFVVRAWEYLTGLEARNPDRPYATILRMKVQDNLRSAEIARRLSEKTGRTATEKGVRKAVFRARILLQEFLIDEVKKTLHKPTFEDLESELIDLGLHGLCREWLKKKRAEAEGVKVH